MEEVVMSAWYLIGALLVFFMQCGFAMVETGFTRAKNAGNIIMKNLMDFCIGTVVFVLLGYGLMNSENYFFGLIGRPDLQLFTDFANFDWSNFVFQLVFCATAATIVSGSMAERTKFSAYCIYSAVISAVIYPIEAGWAWNPQGWLAQLGFIDFAGSCLIHMVGGITALIGAAIVGPRIGKFTRDPKTGKKKANAIPGHSITLGALGCFILWFAWYGFNSAAASSISDMAKILGTTTIAPAVATVTCMIFTWIKNGKPDVGMCLNASLAGLVAITAGCANVDALGATIIGIVAGILVVLIVELLDNKLHIDDPVGAVAVHCANGIWGTIAVGLFAIDGGLFYGGGIHLLGIQLLGVFAVGGYTAITMTAVFMIIKKVHGLRVSAAEEVEGLDSTEHGLANAYADFLPIVPAMGAESVGAVDVSGLKALSLSSSIKSSDKPHKYTNVSIICNSERFPALKDTMEAIGVEGMTVSNVMGCGTQKGKSGQYRGLETKMNLLPKMRVDIVVSKVDPGLVVAAAKKALYTGEVGDGKVFVTDVEDVVRIRTGEQGYDALQFEDGK